jgi:uncharacterized membrane protein YjgN (DUF898 family)
VTVTDHPDQPPGPPGQPPLYQQYQGAYYAPPDHPQATTALVLGILGLVLCGVIAPFAWQMGNRVLREIDGSQGQLGGRGNANAGRIMGIIGTALLVLGLVILLVGGLVFGLVALSANS